MWRFLIRPAPCTGLDESTAHCRHHSKKCILTRSKERAAIHVEAPFGIAPNDLVAWCDGSGKNKPLAMRSTKGYCFQMSCTKRPGHLARSRTLLVSLHRLLTRSLFRMIETVNTLNLAWIIIIKDHSVCVADFSGSCSNQSALPIVPGAVVRIPPQIYVTDSMMLVSYDRITM